MQNVHVFDYETLHRKQNFSKGVVVEEGRDCGYLGRSFNGYSEVITYESRHGIVLRR